MTVRRNRPGIVSGAATGETLSTTGGGELRIVSGKLRRDGEEWPLVRPEEIVGAPPRAGFSTPTPLGTNSAPDSPRTERAGAARRRGMRRVRAVVGACLVTRPVSASAAVAQESSTTTSSTTSTTAPAASTSTSGAPTSTTPKPDPDAFAALANQVSQNQQMLYSAEHAGRPGDAATGRAHRRDRCHPTEARRDALPRWRGCARSCATWWTSTGTPTHRGTRSLTSSTCISVGKRCGSSATQTDNGKVDGLQKVSNQLDAERKQLEASRAEQDEKDRLERGTGARSTHHAPEEAAQRGRRYSRDGRRRTHGGGGHRAVLRLNLPALGWHLDRLP